MKSTVNQAAVLTIAFLMILVISCNFYPTQNTQIEKTEQSASDTLKLGDHIKLTEWNVEDWDESQMVLSHKVDTLASQIIVSTRDTMYLGLAE